MRIETIGDARLILGDCRELWLPEGGFDALVTDPPYGIGEAAGKNASRGNLAISRDYGNARWDDAPVDDILMQSMRNAAKWSIIFGGNYYSLPPTSCWLIWDKLNGDTDFADCEMAWTNLPGAVRRIRYLWNGCMRANGEERGDHPTQKPVGVMTWCLERLPADCRTVFDPFMGSGTTGVACARTGHRFTGIEREETYFDAACRRIELAYRQPNLFEEPIATPVQEILL
jgi:DNA modification methylase